MVAPLSLSEAADLLEGVRRGHLDLDRLPTYPILVVDLDSGDQRLAERLVPEIGWPIVIVGVGSASSARPTRPGTDVLLTESYDPPAPWVLVTEGIDKALLDLQHTLAARPQAGTTLVQVLRSSENASVESALTIESLAYAALQGGDEHRGWLQALNRPSPDPDSAPSVLLEREGPLLQVTLDRPSRRNAYSAKMRDELIEALKLAAADDSIGRVELRGNGPNFCSGGDLAEFGTVTDTGTAHWIRMRRSAGWWLNRIGAKAAVHVHGACVGAGVELPGFAASVEATAGATFALPEVKMGLIPGAGGTASLPRRIGRQRTAWLALTGRPLDAETALDWGLVDRLSRGAD